MATVPTSLYASKKPIEVMAGDRWSIIGASGTGKTYFTTRLLTRLRAYYIVPTLILNSKPDLGLSTLARPIRRAEPPNIVSGLTVWEPPDDIRSVYDEFFRRVLKYKKPLIEYTDELSSIGGNHSDTFPVNYIRLLKQARSQRKTVITGSQELAYIPRQVLGQSTHLVIFRVENEHDIQLARQKMKVKEFDWKDAHGFWYRRLDKVDEGRYFSSVQEFL